MPKFCPKCGTKIENENAKFCPKCGEHILFEEKIEKNVENNIIENDSNNIETESLNISNENINYSRGNTNKVISKNDNIELEIGFKQIIIGIILLGVFYGIYFYINNKEDINSKVAILFSDSNIQNIEEDNINSEKYSSGNTSSGLNTELTNTGNSIEEQTSSGSDENDVDTDKLAEEFLIEHYNNIATHNFEKAFSHFNTDNFTVNNKKIIVDGIKNEEHKKLANSSLKAFSNLWGNVSTITLSDFTKISNLTYSYKATITYTDANVEVYITNPMKLSYQDGIFTIVEYSAKLQK